MSHTYCYPLQQIHKFLHLISRIIKLSLFTTNKYDESSSHHIHCLMPTNSKKYNIIQSSITNQKPDMCIQKTEQYKKTKSNVIETIIY